MIDEQGHRSIATVQRETEATYVEVKEIRAFLDELSREGRSIETVTLAELRGRFSDDAVVLLVDGDPVAIRKVIGERAAYIVKRGHWGP